MRISDWSSDVCSSDLRALSSGRTIGGSGVGGRIGHGTGRIVRRLRIGVGVLCEYRVCRHDRQRNDAQRHKTNVLHLPLPDLRSEEHTSELQSLMRTSYAVFCLKKKTTTT